MARKRKTLPKNFKEMLSGGDIGKLKAVFDSREIDARGGYTKQTALAFDECPDELSRWLVAQGADLSAEDDYGETPLHARAGGHHGNVAILLALGADVRHGEGGVRGTPLHMAAGAGIAENVRLLLAAGAPVEAVDANGHTPLEHALFRCHNALIDRVADVAALLLDAGARITPKCRELVAGIGADFEFHRSGFHPEAVDAVSAALDRLYSMFGAAPVPRRAMHDGKSPIVATASRWEDRFEDLWALLVPSGGAAQTVQGEIIRIAGKIRRELEGNGGVNWDAQFNRMADAWLAYVGAGVPLGANEMREAAGIVSDVKRRRGDTERLCELAVSWVALNPDPVPLPPPAYDR